MWATNLQELKRKTGLSTKQIADRSQIPEGTIKRMLTGENEPSAFNLFRVVKAMGGSLDEILADTDAIIAPPSLVEVKESVEIVVAEKEVVEAKNSVLEAKINALTLENELLKKELLHKDELLAVHEEYLALFKSKVKE